MSADVTLGEAITALVVEKRAVGYKYCTEAKVLARFEAFCRNEFPGLGAVAKWSRSIVRQGFRPLGVGRGLLYRLGVVPGVGVGR